MVISWLGMLGAWTAKERTPYICRLYYARGGEKEEPLPWAGGRLARSDRPPSTGAESKTKPILATLPCRASVLSPTLLSGVFAHVEKLVSGGARDGNMCCLLGAINYV